MSANESTLDDAEVLRLLIKYGTDFDVERTPDPGLVHGFAPKPRVCASSGASLRKQINSGDFEVGSPRARSSAGGDVCRWGIVLRARPYAKTPARVHRTNLYYELTGPTPEALRELHADEQVKAVAMEKKLPPKKSLKDRKDTM